MVDRPRSITARGRSSGSNSTTAADMASGISTAEPSPSRARAAIRPADDPAYAHQSEPAPNTTREASVSRLRP